MGIITGNGMQEEEEKKEERKIGLFEKIKRELFGDEMPIHVLRGNNALKDSKQDEIYKFVQALDSFKNYKKIHEDLSEPLGTLEGYAEGNVPLEAFHGAFNQMLKKARSQAREDGEKHMVELDHYEIKQHRPTVTGSFEREGSFYSCLILGSLYFLENKTENAQG